MTCPACDIAEGNPLSGLTQQGCIECAARELSRSMEHAKARILRTMTPEYMARLREVFGDGWEAGHQRVKRWSMKEVA